MPELPEAKRKRFVDEHALAPSDAATLSSTLLLCDSLRGRFARGRRAANWPRTGFSANTPPRFIANDVEQGPPLSGQQLAGLLKRIQDGTISGKIAKEVFDAMWAGEGDADAIIAQRGLRQISDAGAIEKVVDEVLAANPAIVAEYKAGKEKAFKALVGKAMAATRGKANPAQVNALLRKKLSA